MPQIFGKYTSIVFFAFICVFSRSIASTIVATVDAGDDVLALDLESSNTSVLGAVRFTVDNAAGLYCTTTRSNTSRGIQLTATCTATFARSFAARSSFVHVEYPEGVEVTGDTATEWAIGVPGAECDDLEFNLCVDPLRHTPLMHTLSAAAFGEEIDRHYVELTALPGPASPEACTEAATLTDRNLAPTLTREQATRLLRDAHRSYVTTAPIRPECNGVCASERGIVTAGGVVYPAHEAQPDSGPTHFCAFTITRPRVYMSVFVPTAQALSAEINISPAQAFVGQPDLGNAVISFPGFGLGFSIDQHPNYVVSVDIDDFLAPFGADHAAVLGRAAPSVEVSADFEGLLTTTDERDAWLNDVCTRVDGQYFNYALTVQPQKIMHLATTPVVEQVGDFTFTLYCPPGDISAVQTHVGENTAIGMAHSHDFVLQCNQPHTVAARPAAVAGVGHLSVDIDGAALAPSITAVPCAGSAHAFVGPTVCDYCRRDQYNAGGFGSAECSACPEHRMRGCTWNGEFNALSWTTMYIALAVCGAVGLISVLGCTVSLTARRCRRRKIMAQYEILDD